MREFVIVLRKAQGDDGTSGNEWSRRAHQMVLVRLFLRGCFVLLVALSLGGVDGAGRYAVCVGSGDAGAYRLYVEVAGQASEGEGRGAVVVSLDGNPQVFLGIDVVGVGFCALGSLAAGLEPPAG